ncbi:hypothetical protein BDV93DRAFT_611734 [Ceratobasidium sp. AG-I]|nr:hypothetical protein BDV93DRAFT_611734 [Ceratobasidium sp. AG-I]
MSSSWWTRRASASDRSSTAPPRTTIRAARSFDPPASSNLASSSTLPQIQHHPPPIRSRTNSSSDGRTLTVIANALGFSATSLGKSKSRERLRTGTTSTPESSSRLGPGSTPPSLVHAASFFAVGAGTAPVRRPAKTSLGETSSRIPRSSSNRQTVVSTESGSSWGATSSAEPHEPTGSSWEPTTPSSGSEPKHSFQSMGMIVDEDPFARSPVWIAGGGTGTNEMGVKSRKKEKERERQPYPERTRRLGVSAGSDVGEDGSVSPLLLSTRSAAFPVPPETVSMLPRRAASALAPSSSLAPRPVGARSHSANSPGAQYIPLPSPGGYVSSPGPTTPTTPGSQPLTPISPQPTPPISPRPNTSQLPTPSTSARPRPATQPYRVPSLHIPTVSALEMHAHASAAETYSPHSQSEFGSDGSPGSFISPVDEIGLAMSGMGIAIGEMGELESGRERMGLDEPRAVTEGYAMRRGHSAHAILSRAGGSRDPIAGSSSKPGLASGSTKPLVVSANKAPVGGTGKSLMGVGVGRAGMGIGGVVGMGSMTALASGIVTGLGEEGVGGDVGRRGPPKRPSRSELRGSASTASLRSGQVAHPVRSTSLYPAPRHAPAGRLGEVDEDASGVARTASLSVSPATSTGTSPAPSSAVSPATTPNASTASTPNASSVSVLGTTPSSRPWTRDTTPTSPSPIKPHPGLVLPRAPSPPRVSEESFADLEHYRFAPVIEDADSASLELGEDFGFELEEGDQWLPWSEEDSHHLGAGNVSGSGRRPPPSPTNLPWMAGNAGRRPTRRDAVYPSGVHIIPTAALRDLASIGRQEDSVRAAVTGGTVVEEEEEEQTTDTILAMEDSPLRAQVLCPIEEKFPTPPASAPPSSPSPVHPLTLLSSNSTGSLASSCSSLVPESVPVTVSSRVEFSRHARSGSYSDSELDVDTGATQVKFARTRKTSAGKSRVGTSSALVQTGTSTAVAWRCGSGNHQKCCGTRSLQEGPNMGRWKCCAERTPSGKSARCCASFVGRPCERARVSSTSSASVHEAAKALKRQRSFHLSSLSGMGSGSGAGSSPGPGAAGAGGAGAMNTAGKRNRFFHRPHTSHGKSTSSALLDDDVRSMHSVKSSKEDPGPIAVVGLDDVFGPRPVALATVASPPTSPLARHEFKAQYILSPAKLHDHLKKEATTPPATVPTPPTEPGLKSPRLEPSRARSNTTNTNVTATSITTDTSGSHRSAFSVHSSDHSAPMRSLLPPRRVHNTSLPAMVPMQAPDHPRRYVRSTSTLSQPSSGPPPPPRSPIISPGLPPPPRGRVGAQPIVSFISSRSLPTPRTSEAPKNGMGAAVALKHHSSRESCESASTLRRERSIPLREGPVSFLEIDMEEESGAEDEEDEEVDELGQGWARPALQHSRSFLDLSSRQSGDTMRENEAMFS